MMNANLVHLNNKSPPIALPQPHVLSPIAPQFPLLLLEYYRTISLSLASFFAIPP